MFTDLLNNTIPLIQSGMRWALEALANSLWQGVALTIALALVLHFSPRLRASSRYALWYVALFAVVSLPILGMQKVAGEYALNLYENVQSFASQNSEPFSEPTAETVAQPEALTTFASSNTNTSSSEPIQSNQSIHSEATTTSASGVVPADASISSASLATTTQPAHSTTTTASRNPRITKASSEPAPLRLALPDWLALGLLAFWIVGSTLFLTRLFLSFEHLRKLRRNAIPIDSVTSARFYKLSAALNLKRKTLFLLSNQTKTPLAVGLGTPAVIFPTELFGQLSDSEKDQVALHELIHLKRYDDWGALAQRLVNALFFFNPAALWISSKLDLERELACDESVVENMNSMESIFKTQKSSKEYAGCLTRLAELSSAPRHSALAAGAFFSGKRLTIRVEKILANKLRISARFSRVIVATLGVMMFGALALFTLAPKVIAFDERDEARRAKEARLSGHGPIELIGTVPSPSDFGYSYSYITGVQPLTSFAAVESEGDNTSPKHLRELREHLRSLKRDQAIMQKDLARQQYYLQRDNFNNLRRNAKGHVEAVAPNIYRFYTDDNGRKHSTFFHRSAPRNDDADDDVLFPQRAPYAVALGDDSDDDGDSRYFFSPPSPPSPPSVPSVPSIPSISGITGITYSNGLFEFGAGDGDIHYTWNKGSKRFKIRARGEITFNKDGTDVESVSDEGYITIEERTRDYDREYEVYAYEDGTLDRTYYDDGRRTEIDDEARKWIEETILTVMRNTGIGAEARVSKLMKEGGVDLVLAEIDEIDSDHTRRRYYSLILEHDELTNSEVAEIIHGVSLSIDSDYERAELLSGLNSEYLKDETVLAEYVQAIVGIDSDYEKRRALSNVFSRRELASQTLIELLAVAEEFDSDYERSQLLGEIAERGLGDESVREAYIAAIAGISSGYEKRQALSKIAGRKDLGEESLLAALELAETISSDYERAQLLVELFPEREVNTRVMDAYVRAVEDISSNYEKRRTLSQLTQRDHLSPKTVLAILNISESITSDYERAELLKDMADYCRDDNKLWAAYVSAVEGVDSDYEKGKVLSEMELDEPVDEAVMISALQIISSMESDYEKGKLLRKFASICLESDNLREPFLDAVDTIDSDYERNSLLDKIYKRDRKERRKGR